MYPKSLRHKARGYKQDVDNIPSTTNGGCVLLIENVENAACLADVLESATKLRKLP